MFLKNWYKALTAMLYNSEDVTGKSTNGTDMRFTSKSASSGIYNIIFLTMAGGASLSSYNNVPYMGKVQTSYNGGVVFGTGDIPPHPDDYILSGSLITTISAVGNVTATQDDNGITFTGLYTVTNTGSEDITVNEIGLVTTSAYSTSYRYLIERTVLDTPVTIPAGGIGQVTYTIRMNYPTA